MKWALAKLWQEHLEEAFSLSLPTRLLLCRQRSLTSARVCWMSLRLLTSQPSDGLGSHTSALKFNGAPGSPQGLGQLPPFSASSVPHQGPGAQASLRRLLQLIWVRGRVPPAWRGGWIVRALPWKGSRSLGRHRTTGRDGECLPDGLPGVPEVKGSHNRSLEDEQNTSNSLTSVLWI